MQMKFKAHQSFFIRKGWLGKGLRGVKDNGGILMPSCSKDAMDELGLGSNQVVALRYWLEAAGLIVPTGRRRAHKLTELGALVLEEDPYTEESGTLWAIHCNIASAREAAAAWYFFFNEFNVSGSFDKAGFVEAINRYIFTYNDKKDVALTSLDADFNCILSTYIPHDRTSGKAASPESVIDCPLGELGLIDVESRAAKKYRKMPANPSTLPALLVLYSICSMRELQEDEGAPAGAEMRLDTLLNGPYSPGRLYNLDSVALLEKLYELEEDGLIRITRTAGLDVVRLAESDMTKANCLARYYDLIG